MVVVCFDLKSEEADYEGLQNAIRRVSGVDNAIGVLGGVWLIDTVHSAREVYNMLRAYINNGDRIFVSTIAEKDRQGWIASSSWTWIRRHEGCDGEAPSEG